jgi:hypothetical protein
MLLWRCHHRSISLLIGDVVSSLLLLWILFYEQYSDKILLKIKFYLQQKVEAEEEDTQIRRKVFFNEQFIIIASFQSLVFILQVIFASLSFIATLLSYEHKGI